MLTLTFTGQVLTFKGPVLVEPIITWPLIPIITTDSPDWILNFFKKFKFNFLFIFILILIFIFVMLLIYMWLPIIAYYCTWCSSLNFHALSYNSWLVQDIEPWTFHLHTLDLSTNRFFQALRNLCENMQTTTALAARRSFPPGSAALRVSVHADLFHTWSGHLVPLHASNQTWGPGQHCRAQERTPRPPSHQTAQKVPIYSPGMCNMQ